MLESTSNVKLLEDASFLCAFFCSISMIPSACIMTSLRIPYDQLIKWCLRGSKVWRPGLERNQWGRWEAEAMKVSRNPEGPSQRPSRTNTSREELHVLRNQDEDQEIPTGWSYTEAIRQESFTGKGRRKVWGMGERFYRTEPALRKLQHSTKQKATPRERWELKDTATNTEYVFWPWTLRNGLPSGAAVTSLVPVKTQ